MAKRGIGVALIALLVLAGLTVFVEHASCVSYVVFTDADKDGIDDNVEHRLLEKYRPYFRFTSGEDYRPCDPIWLVRRSELLPSSDEQDAPIAGNVILRQNPRFLLMEASIILVPGKMYNRYLNPRGEEPRHGQDWSVIRERKNVGLFGHVVPWQSFYKIEYYQFFGYSQAGLSVGLLEREKSLWRLGDHECDCEYIHLLFDPTTSRLVKTFHYAHGKEISFDLTTQWVRQVSLSDEVLEFRGPLFDRVDEFAGDNINYVIPWYCDRRVRFYRDPDTGEYTHPVVYVEKNCHGLWPTEHWRYGVYVEWGGSWAVVLCA